VQPPPAFTLELVRAPLVSPDLAWCACVCAEQARPPRLVGRFAGPLPLVHRRDRDAGTSAVLSPPGPALTLKCTVKSTSIWVYELTVRCMHDQVGIDMSHSTRQGEGSNRRHTDSRVAFVAVIFWPDGRSMTYSDTCAASALNSANPPRRQACTEPTIRTWFGCVLLQLLSEGRVNRTGHWWWCHV
jgi:hypothetical protein